MARKSLTSIPVEYQLCRGPQRHHWELSTPPPGNQRGTSFGYLMYWVCTCCTMERFDTYNYLGHLAQRSYNQPDGYHFAKDEAPTREQLILSLTLEYGIEGNGSMPPPKKNGTGRDKKKEAAKASTNRHTKDRPSRPRGGGPRSRQRSRQHARA